MPQSRYTTYPQTRSGIYLNLNNKVPLFVNGVPAISQQVCGNSCQQTWHRYVPSFGQDMIDEKIQMSQPGVVTTK